MPLDDGSSTIGAMESVPPLVRRLVLRNYKSVENCNIRFAPLTFLVGGYSETTDQPALTEGFDIQAARSADSFDKFYRDVSALLSPRD